MAAIMSWKWWNREKSYFMFLNIAKFIQSDDKVCLDFAWKLEQAGAAVFIDKKVALDWNILKNIDAMRTKIFWKFTEDKEEKVLSDTQCLNYVNKAIRELNLEYIEKWNKKYEAEKWIYSVSAKELYDLKYIDYLPVDFQQYKDYGIIYYYNKDIKNYDYKMWTYAEISY
jgi:hypothetical protein